MTTERTVKCKMGIVAKAYQKDTKVEISQIQTFAEQFRPNHTWMEYWIGEIVFFLEWPQYDENTLRWKWKNDPELEHHIRMGILKALPNIMNSMEKHVPGLFTEESIV